MDKRYKVHVALDYPGVTHMLYYVKSKNLSFSVDEFKLMVRAVKCVVNLW